MNVEIKEQPSKTKNIIKMILIYLVGIQLIVTGIAKGVLPLFDINFGMELMEHINYGYKGTLLIALIDFIGGFLLFIPKYRGYTLVFLGLFMAGAVSAHITIQDPLATIVGGSVLTTVLLAVIFWLDKPFTVIDNHSSKKVL